ncbi:MAG: MBL fold metallo-hydrolase [Sphingorhabdus sp.]
MTKKAILPVFALLASCTNGIAENGRLNQCASKEFALQTLGTGGPIADDARAGSSNLLWIGGKGRLLVDFGPGFFTRYGEAAADFNDLDMLLFTHAHGDHVGGLAGLLNSGGFAGRSRSLELVGPGGDEFFAGPAQLRDGIIGSAGELPYLKGYSDGSEGKPPLTTRAIDTGKSGLQQVFRDEDIEIDAIAVHHGPAPALAFVVRYKGKVIVFAGDHSAMSEDFVKVLAGSKPDILVMHNVISMAGGQPRGLHRDGLSIGEAAAAIAPKRLLLTHHMLRALKDKDAVMAAIGKNYTGEIAMADDLDCFGI